MTSRPTWATVMKDPYDHNETIFDAVRNGSEQALIQLWKEYYPRTNRLARSLLPTYFRRQEDDEDVSIVALQTVFSGLREGKFDAINSRDQFWALVIVVTRRKASNVRRSVHRDPAGFAADISTQALTSDHPSPDMTEIAREELDHIETQLGLLTRHAIELSIIGYAPKEISRDLGVTVRTVSRMLARARATADKSDKLRH